jgi:hypothetical protein
MASMNAAARLVAAMDLAASVTAMATPAAPASASALGESDTATDQRQTHDTNDRAKNVATHGSLLKGIAAFAAGNCASDNCSAPVRSFVKRSSFRRVWIS